MNEQGAAFNDWNFKRQRTKNLFLSHSKRAAIFILFQILMPVFDKTHCSDFGCLNGNVSVFFLKKTESFFELDFCDLHLIRKGSKWYV